MKILEYIKPPYRLRYFSIIILCMLILGGCATLFSGTKDKITFSSDVDGIRIYIEGRLVGKTPVELEVQRKPPTRGVLVRFEKEGFETQEFHLTKKLNTTAIWNSTFLPSWATDVLSGAWYEYEPLKYHVELVPQGKMSFDPDFFRRRWIHRYVMVNFDRILKDLSKGEGEYMNGLGHLAMSGDKNGLQHFLQYLKSQRVLLLSAPSRSTMLHLVERIQKGYKSGGNRTNPINTSGPMKLM